MRRNNKNKNKLIKKTKVKNYNSKIIFFDERKWNWLYRRSPSTIYRFRHLLFFAPKPWSFSRGIESPKVRSIPKNWSLYRNIAILKTSIKTFIIFYYFYDTSPDTLKLNLSNDCVKNFQEPDGFNEYGNFREIKSGLESKIIESSLVLELLSFYSTLLYTS